MPLETGSFKSLFIFVGTLKCQKL